MKTKVRIELIDGRILNGQMGTWELQSFVDSLKDPNTVFIKLDENTFISTKIIAMVVFSEE